MCGLFAQEKYTVPELSYEKKHSKVLGETYGFLTTGIHEWSNGSNYR